MKDAARGVQSIEVGARLLDVLAAGGEPMMLRDIAKQAGVASAQAHAYLTSYRKQQFVEQDEGTGRYRLGPFALQLGISRLRILDPHQIAAEICSQFANEIGLTVAVIVWGSYGPTAVSVHEGADQILISTRPGTVYSLTGSASGRIFLQHMPNELVTATFEEQRAEGFPGRYTGELPDIRSIAKEMHLVAELGYAATDSYPQPGVSAISAPVFDAGGQMVMAVTLIGGASAMDVGPAGFHVSRVLAAARRISAKLGYSEDLAPRDFAPARFPQGASTG